MGYVSKRGRMTTRSSRPLASLAPAEQGRYAYGNHDGDRRRGGAKEQMIEVETPHSEAIRAMPGRPAHALAQVGSLREEFPGPNAALGGRKVDLRPTRSLLAHRPGYVVGNLIGAGLGILLAFSNRSLPRIRREAGLYWP